MPRPTLDFPYNEALPYPFLRPEKEGSPALIFVHIPKTGGTSIRKALNLPPPQREIGLIKHFSAAEICQHLPSLLWKSSYKFAFVRNPYTRLYSHYQYRLREGRIEQRYGQKLAFSDWVPIALKEETAGNLKPQYQWVCNEDGEQIVDFVGRFEQLTSGFAQIMSNTGVHVAQLEHLNRSPVSAGLETVYDDVARHLAYDFYQEDFERYGYAETLI